MSRELPGKKEEPSNSEKGVGCLAIVVIILAVLVLIALLG